MIGTTLIVPKLWRNNTSVKSLFHEKNATHIVEAGALFYASEVLALPGVRPVSQVHDVFVVETTNF